MKIRLRKIFGGMLFTLLALIIILILKKKNHNILYEAGQIRKSTSRKQAF